MARKKNVRLLAFKGVLCLLALPAVVSIFTSKASLQNTNSANTVRNVNRLPSRTPRRPSNRPANARAETANIEPAYLPDPTPTPAASTVRGRVFYAETGRPVKRSIVMLMSDDGSGPGNSSSGVTDGEGNFQIKNVRAGTYYAMVNAPGVVSPLAFADFSKKSEREFLKDAFENFARIIVDGLTDVSVEIPAYRGGAIGGRVIYDDGDPAIGVKVEILRKVGEKYMGVIPNFSAIVSMMGGGSLYQTDDRGVYRFPGLPPGDYIIKVTENTTHGETIAKNYYDPFESLFSASSFLTIFYPDALVTKDAQLINVQLGQEISEINLTIPSRGLYKLEGKIVNLKDKSPVKAKITIKRNVTDDVYTLFSQIRQRQPDSTLTDEYGNWKFKDLPKGTYRVIVEPVESDNEYRQYLGDYSNANVAVNAERNVPPKPKLAKKTQEIVIEDKDLTETVIEVGYGATISGTAAVENSQEMPSSMTIQVSGEKDENTASVGIMNYIGTNQKTPAKINHDFKLEAVPEGKNYFMVFTEGGDYFVKSVTVNGIDLLADPVTVKEGEVLRNVQIVLSADLGTLKGTVLNDEKVPVKRAGFLLVPTDAAKRKNPSFYRDATAGENGEFEVRGAPGEYAVIFTEESLLAKSREEMIKWFDNAVKGAQIVKIEAGKTETVTVRKKN
jgi:hypothetical protein